MTVLTTIRDSVAQGTQVGASNQSFFLSAFCSIVHVTATCQLCPA